MGESRFQVAVSRVPLVEWTGILNADLKVLSQRHRACRLERSSLISSQKVGCRAHPQVDLFRW